MTYSCIEKLEGKYYANKPLGLLTDTNTTLSMINTSHVTSNPMFLSDDPVEAKIMISMSVTFISGVIQVNLK